MLDDESACILFVGYGTTSTGFSRVLSSILGDLPNRYRLHHLTIDSDQLPETSRWTSHPNILPGDVYGVAQLDILIEDLHPTIVLVLHNLEYYGFYSSVFERYKDDVKVVHYCAIDSATCHPGEIEQLSTVDQLVVFTDFGQRVLEDGANLVRGGQPSFKLPPLQVIPLGVDTDLFHPLCGGNDAAGFATSRRVARRLLFADSKALEDAFIVLNANQNNGRKRIDITIEGFARFARDKPESVRLYLHTSVHGYGFDLLSLARRHGVERRLIVAADGPEHPSVPSEVLNLIYNSCDVGVNTCMREGWGLISFEHAATGAAQIVPKHSACEEVWRGSAMLLEPAGRFIDRDMRENVLVSAEGVAEALERLYESRDVLDEMAVLAYKNATKPQYRWTNVAQQWDSLFQRMVSPSR